MAERHVEVVGDVADCVAGQEAVDEVLHARCAARDHGESKCDVGIDDDICASVSRESHLGGPAVVAVGDAPKVVANQFGELRLARSDDKEFEQVVFAALVGVVVEHLSAVCVEALRGECVHDADLAGQRVDGGADPLQGDTRATEGGH